MQRSIVTIAMIAFGCAATFAHHSMAGTYILDQRITISGAVIEVGLRNPHSYVLVEVRVNKTDASAERWGAEWEASFDELDKAGITRTTLKAGDVVQILGAPGKISADHRLLIHTISRPVDGGTSTGPWRELWIANTWTHP